MTDSSLARVVRDVAAALVLFAVVYLASGAAAGVAACLFKGSALAAGLAAQLVLLTLSVAAARLAGGDLRDYGFKLSASGVARASIASAVCAIALAVAGSVVAGGERPELGLPGDPAQLALLALAVAPICEEALFRGLVQGYLLTRGHAKLSVAVSAVLFSVAHVLPFSSASPALLSVVLAGALALGVVAGHFRAASGSLVPAVAAHFWFNLVGLLAALA